MTIQVWLGSPETSPVLHLFADGQCSRKRKLYRAVGTVWDWCEPSSLQCSLKERGLVWNGVRCTQPLPVMDTIKHAYLVHLECHAGDW